MLTIGVVLDGASGRAEGGEQPRISTLAIKFCSEKSRQALRNC